MARLYAFLRPLWTVRVMRPGLHGKLALQIKLVTMRVIWVELTEPVQVVSQVGVHCYSSPTTSKKGLGMMKITLWPLTTLVAVLNEKVS